MLEESLPLNHQGRAEATESTTNPLDVRFRAKTVSRGVNPPKRSIRKAEVGFPYNLTSSKIRFFGIKFWLGKRPVDFFRRYVSDFGNSYLQFLRNIFFIY